MFIVLTEMKHTLLISFIHYSRLVYLFSEILISLYAAIGNWLLTSINCSLYSLSSCQFHYVCSTVFLLWILHCISEELELRLESKWFGFISFSIIVFKIVNSKQFNVLGFMEGGEYRIPHMHVQCTLWWYLWKLANGRRRIFMLKRKKHSLITLQLFGKCCFGLAFSWFWSSIVAKMWQART